jgi:Predicted transcriptional regulators containing the CopG/Arc/MetJ DNA-binding domain
MVTKGLKTVCTDSRPIQIYLPLSYVKSLDLLVGGGFYSSRSEAIRVAVNDLIRSELPLLS